MLTVGIISDLHFGPEARFDGKLRKLTSQAPALSRAFVREMNDRVKPDVVVNLGDDIEDHDAATDQMNYTQCQRILAGVNCPLLNVAGNHDTIHLKANELLHAWRRAGKLYYSLDVAGFHIVVLHTIEQRGVKVHVDREQLRWIEQDIGQSQRPVLVFMHHPASEQSFDDSRWFANAPHLAHVDNRVALRAIFEASGRVRGVFNGHVHRNHFDVIRGIPYVTFQSLIENLDDDAPGRVAGAFGVVRVTDDRVVVRVHGNDPARYQVGPD